MALVKEIPASAIASGKQTTRLSRSIQVSGSARGFFVTRSIVNAALAATLLLGGGALAQTTPDAGQAVEPMKPVLLEPAKQARIREDVKMRAPAPQAAVQVGATVPTSVSLYALPEDSVTELPQVTTYRFFLAGDSIAIVDPASRTVVQLIDK
jgi:hypothetical protein